MKSFVKDDLIPYLKVDGNTTRSSDAAEEHWQDVRESFEFIESFVNEPHRMEGAGKKRSEIYQ
jgi:hypothetical protein